MDHRRMGEIKDRGNEKWWQIRILIKRWGRRSTSFARLFSRRWYSIPIPLNSDKELNCHVLYFHYVLSYTACAFWSTAIIQVAIKQYLKVNNLTWLWAALKVVNSFLNLHKIFFFFLKFWLHFIVQLIKFFLWVCLNVDLQLLLLHREMRFSNCCLWFSAHEFSTKSLQ